MEDGEVSGIHHTHAETGYDPAYEWPGDIEVPQPAVLNEALSSTFRPWPLLRLLVQTSSVLPRAQRLAVLDEYEEVQFGRDIAPAGSRTPRVRLKEMAVSKVHATMFWDAGRREWAVVDMGSKHGSFLRPGGYIGPTVITGEDLGVRLSPPRVASFPRALKHGDALTMGNTTFVVHIHIDRMSCEGCASSESGEDVIPLFQVSKVQNQGIKRAREEVNPIPAEGRDAKKALTMLKRTLLSRHNQARSSPSSQSSSYVDRSAKRRSLYPSSPLDSPGAPSPRSNSPSAASSSSTSAPSPTPENPPKPQPLPESNIGRRLLMKQGWEPGTALGSGENASALIEPLEASAPSHRAGLGMPDTAPTSFGGDWRESGKQKRWANLDTK
ncbi:hypothetical protein K503DRAFT_736123 [Rhizopogon vinicolor AM-OR11-026]|uniref:SMAD/FHA domain-containing protein n=1 Tax=Rhizopogon vinicolor AM-OR11-026 TaxID=1314800 RepID=A0A1B7N8I1_9AGAM|nr:hypothetical protein K503DRAFT_736123 [Rhizopogon vinicolor AM-OR11-026]